MSKSLFGNAAVLDKPKKATAKPDKQQVSIDGLELYAKVDVAEKSIKTLKETLRTDITTQIVATMLENADNGKRPASLRGVEGKASASLELRVRGANSPLNDDEIAMLRDAGVEPAEVITQQFLYAINPTHASNKALMGKVEQALLKIVPKDFFVIQEEVKKHVANEDVVNECFAKRVDASVIALTVTPACKPKLDEPNIAEILDEVRELIVDETEVAVKDTSKGGGRKSKAA